jgi:hypothetical protein
LALADVPSAGKRVIPTRAMFNSGSADTFISTDHTTVAGPISRAFGAIIYFAEKRKRMAASSKPNNCLLFSMVTSTIHRASYHSVTRHASRKRLIRLLVNNIHQPTIASQMPRSLQPQQAFPSGTLAMFRRCMVGTGIIFLTIDAIPWIARTADCKNHNSFSPDASLSRFYYIERLNHLQPCNIYLKRCG